MIHFELIFVNPIKSLSRLIYLFSACGCSVVPAPFADKTIFFTLYCLSTFCQRSVTIFSWVYFWALCFVPLVYSLDNTTHCLGYCSLIISIEVGE